MTDKTQIGEKNVVLDPIDFEKHRYPLCLVWTPIPLLTWFFPFIGHLGIADSVGVIRDFAGPYHVSTDNMGFGWPTRYKQFNIDLIDPVVWDMSVQKASDTYKDRMHNLLTDNCHSHVAMALNMIYKSDSWNMVNLALDMFVRAKYVGVSGFLKTWTPFAFVLVMFAIIYSI